MHNNNEIKGSASPTLQKKRSLQQLKQKLTRSELIALQYSFNKLKTVSNHLEYIELKTFLQHLNLPSPLEKAGVLLFKSFSYLGTSHPYGQLSISSTSAIKPDTPLLLSWDAFLTAFVILTGKLDTDHDPSHINFEVAFFESLAILPPTFTSSSTATAISTSTETITATITASSSSKTETKNDLQKETTTIVNNEDDQNHIITQTKGLSLADLGIQFDEMDDFDTLMNDQSAINNNKKDDSNHKDKDNDKEKEKEDGKKINQPMRILCNDLKELFMFVLWIVHVERKKNENNGDDIMEDILSVESLAKRLIKSIQLSTTTTMNNNSNNDEVKEEESITHDDFYKWKNRNAPYLFKIIQSFIYTHFTLKLNYLSELQKKNHPQEEDEKEEKENEEGHFDIILSQDQTPIPDHTDILSINMCALLSWCLPEEYFTIKEWRRLYSGDKDGFSMNRFESHVFKYPGPTLFIMKIQSTENHHHCDKKEEEEESFKIIGGLITVPWKQGKHYWGNDQCFLFELYPKFECYRAKKGMNQQYIYCQSQFGFGFGGTSSYMQTPTSNTFINHENESIIDQYMIYLDNGLQTGQYYHDPFPKHATFEKTNQFTCSSSPHHYNNDYKYKFETLHVEVFGLGNEKLTQLQKKAWQFETQEANRRAGVQIRQQDGQVDKEILRMAGIIQGDSDHYRHSK
ncbi:unnamed protein product [Cunninghamella blakesleeana]